MKAKAKDSNTPYPIWVQGEYITEPPVRPKDGAVRPIGHYIDKGGYPGANVYEIDVNTLCRQTTIVDRLCKAIYEMDILLYETVEEISYFIVQDADTVIDVITGEIIEIKALLSEDIKNIGNIIDHPDFIEGIKCHVENGIDIPYILSLDVNSTALPYFKLKCLKCGHTTLSCSYMAKHKDCGGYFTLDYATGISRKRTKEKELA